jgi:hypothetical protein
MSSFESIAAAPAMDRQGSDCRVGPGRFTPSRSQIRTWFVMQLPLRRTVVHLLEALSSNAGCASMMRLGRTSLLCLCAT